MKIKAVISVVLMLGFFTQDAAAAAVSAAGRTYSFSCGYFSRQVGEVEVTFKDRTLPWGSSVELVAGWSGTSLPGRTLDWTYTSNTPMTAVAAYTWQAKAQQTLASRSSPERLDGFQFVFLVTLPNGTQYYEKGTHSPRGFYFSRIWGSTASDCLKSSEALPDFTPLDVETVSRY